MKIKLRDAASVIRSKNSGPYELTFDIIFKDQDLFDAAAASGVLSSELIENLFSVKSSDVAGVVEFPPAKAIKITIKREVVSGGPLDRDVYGAQQHAPLLNVEFEYEGRKQ